MQERVASREGGEDCALLTSGAGTIVADIPFAAFFNAGSSRAGF